MHFHKPRFCLELRSLLSGLGNKGFFTIAQGPLSLDELLFDFTADMVIAAVSCYLFPPAQMMNASFGAVAVSMASVNASILGGATVASLTGDNFFAFAQEGGGGPGQKKAAKQEAAKNRSKHPIGKRIRFPSRKKAYEAAKRAGKGREPVLHTYGHGPHYHPANHRGRQLNHDHCYFPKGQI